jgi:predicted DNA-binding transcriptional regulator AlpA
MQHPLRPNGPLVPPVEFFERRFLRSKDLIRLGLVPNQIQLWRWVKSGQFPAPLRLTSRIMLWDSVEIAALIDRLGAERNSEEKAAAL